jgi:hypothetical protein
MLKRLQQSPRAWDEQKINFGDQRCCTNGIVELSSIEKREKKMQSSSEMNGI